MTTIHPPNIVGNDATPTYFWADMPADARDRAIVLRIAEARGIRPRWTDRARSPRERLLARLDRLEAASEAIATRLIAGGAP